MGSNFSSWTSCDIERLRNYIRKSCNCCLYFIHTEAIMSDLRGAVPDNCYKCISDRAPIYLRLHLWNGVKTYQRQYSTISCQPENSAALQVLLSWNEMLPHNTQKLCSFQLLVIKEFNFIFLLKSSSTQFHQYFVWDFEVIHICSTLVICMFLL